MADTTSSSELIQSEPPSANPSAHAAGTEESVHAVEGVGTYAYADVYFFVFTTFAKAFRVELSRQTLEDLKVLLPVMETTEKTLGSLTDPDEREAFVAHVLGFYRGEREPYPAKAGEVEHLLLALRDALRRRDRVELFVDMLDRIFKAREVMMSTEDIDEFLAARLEDGVLAANFAQVFVDEQPNRMLLADFKVLVSKMFNCVDTLLDARKDYAEGQVKVKPTFRFYRKVGWTAAGLFLTFFRRVPSFSSLVRVTWHVTGREVKLALQKRRAAPRALAS